MRRLRALNKVESATDARQLSQAVGSGATAARCRPPSIAARNPISFTFKAFSQQDLNLLRLGAAQVCLRPFLLQLISRTNLFTRFFLIELSQFPKISKASHFFRRNQDGRDKRRREFSERTIFEVLLRLTTSSSVTSREMLMTSLFLEQTTMPPKSRLW